MKFSMLSSVFAVASSMLVQVNASPLYLRGHTDFSVAPSIDHFNIKSQKYISMNKDLDLFGVASGALVFDGEGRLLIIQRAASDSSPNLWEVPGGAVDDDDETILHGVVRETFEEAGLVVTDVKHQVGGPYDFTTRRGKKIRRFSFEVEVESTKRVTLDPKEHQNYFWATEEECRNGKVLSRTDNSYVNIEFTSPAMREYILLGFELHKTKTAKNFA